MIRGIRKKFIVTAMVSVAIVLALIITVIDVSNYINTKKIMELRMDALILNERSSERIRPDGPFGGKERMNLYAEAPFDARYFSVTFSEDGNIKYTDTANILSVDGYKAGLLAESVYSSGRERGYIESFYFRRFTGGEGVKGADLGDTKYIFLDGSRELSSFHSYIITSITVSIIGMLLVFVLIYFFSGVVLRPVAESYDKQKRFITDASHEIKTPLGIIGANTEVIELESGESEWTRSIRHQIDRLTSLTEKLVFLSRMDEGAAQPVKRDFDMSSMVRETAEAYIAVAKSKNRAYDIRVEDGIRLNGDEDSIRQALSLLLDNAMKYSNEGGRIVTELKPYKKGRRRVRLTVKNTVDKIETGSHDEMFERFYRADKSRSSANGGHGIGLAVVRAIAEAHGGRVRAFSENDGSIEFSVYL